MSSPWSHRSSDLGNQKDDLDSFRFFLVDVLVEISRNEIETPSARLRTFDCHKRNFNHVGLLFDLS